ncbi:MAG: M3 family oligoendopeptidase [Sphingobacteriales bacterium]|nr:M3 family oligoendopeptidase [Sphingobacteriales bacterium]MBI3718652.1 M3 family oligoendopeptidase [Sphingobacteriales bacterium]
MTYSADIKKLERHYFPKDFAITTWDALEPYFKELLERPINSLAELEQWLKDLSEAEAITNEDACWRQIKMTCDTENKQLEEAFNYFYVEILPRMQPYADKLNRKLVDCPFTAELDKEKYLTYLRGVKKNIELFRDENIPIQSELAVLQQHFGAIAGKMTVTVNGQEYTLQQASKFLENEDRNLREEVYRKIFDRRLQDKEAMNNLFNQLVEKRNQLAVNAGMPSYTEYRFKELGRFDYTEKECFQFHEAVKQYVLPLVNKIYDNKKKKLGLDTLRPWDIEAHPAGEKSLNPFTTGKDLLYKTIQCFSELNPFFADCIAKMNQMGHLDLESRKGKAPGGYNCPLAESGAPFIFMNAAGQMDDVTTMVHEGGHAVHSFLAHNLELNAFKDYPMEIAEVASMSMELFSMPYWNTFFDSEEDLKKAKEHQLERVITIFPWIATIDKFQHWIYANPKHTNKERTAKWVEILNEFSSGAIDFTGLENYRAINWQKQLHLFEVPFYYIEYGIAQLGAIGMWKQFMENRKKALENYTNALSLGGTKTLVQLFETAGLKFDFSPAHIKTLMEFVHQQMEEL